MRGVSTFGAFTTARLGIMAAQKALDVTGHNITNINTVGYTRQRLDQMSLRVGGNNRYTSANDVIVGSGVLCTGISQLRDPYLDIRFRNEQSSVGAMDTKLSGLEEISNILDEVAKGDGSGVLESQFNDLISQLQILSRNAGKEENDTLVRSSADSLVKLLNSYADQLKTVQENQDRSLRQDIDTINNILKNIGDLNSSIYKSELHGDSALELKDQRNLLIDQLSQYVKINVEYKSTDVGSGKSIDELVIRLAGTSKGDPTSSKTTLVDGSYSAQFSLRKEPKLNEKYDPDYTIDPLNPNDPRGFKYVQADGALTNDDKAAASVDNQNYNFDLSALKNAGGTVKPGTAATPTPLGDLDLYGALQSAREMLTEAGEYTSKDMATVDKDAVTKRGLPYYQKSLDSLANKLASVLNEANTGYMVDDKGTYMDKDGKPITDGGVPLTTATPLKDLLKNPNFTTHAVKLGGTLFSNSSKDNNTSGITAANISISKDWSVGKVRILNSKVMGSKPGELDSGSATNIVHMISLIDGKHAFKANEVVPGANEGDTAFFNGSFQEMLANISGTLAKDVKSTSVLLNNYVASATDISVSRSSVSSVDLNDEATNLMQFQKSYSAACRLMTTLDEALDKLINGTGVVGR